MDSVIYTYALAKTFRDKGEDLLDSFLPFIIQVISEDPVAVYSISAKLRDQIKLEIPLLTLNVALKRGEVKGYVEQTKRDRFKITKIGQDYKNSLESHTSVERRTNALIIDIQEFFKSHHISIDESSLKNLLDEFIIKNIGALIQYFKGQRKKNEDIFVDHSSYDQLLIEYIKNANSCKPEHYNTLKDMILGSIVLLTIQSGKYTEFHGNNKFKNCVIYLDANIVFSLFRCHSNEDFVASSQLIQLIKEAGCAIKVFKFTVDEIVHYLGGYYKKGLNGNHIERQDIYGKLYSKAWKKSDIQTFISKIPEKLTDLGIDLDETIDVNLNTFHAKNREDHNNIRSYKPVDSKRTINHDLAAIETIRKMRGIPVYHIQDANSIFLTADKKLYGYNYSGMEHESSGTVGEVILDVLLTTIIWLNNPSVDVPLSMIISAHSKGIFTKWVVWDKFFSETEKLQKSGLISEEDILMLHYNNYIDDALKTYEECEIDQITPEMIINLAERAKVKFEDEKKKEANIHEEITNQMFGNAYSKCENYAQNILLGVTFLPILGFFGCIAYMVQNGYELQTIGIICGIISAGIIILNYSIGSFNDNVKIKYKNNLANWIYKKWENLMKK